MKINVNKDLKSLELTTSAGDTINLTTEETKRFFEDMYKVKSEFGHLFTEFTHKISLQEVMEIIENRNDNGEFCGINFFGERLLRVDHVSFYATCVFEKNHFREVLPTDIHDNFRKGYLWEGEISNFDIRNCLTDDLIQFFKEHPEFYISYDGKNITTEVIFDDEKSIYILEESFDT